MTPDSSRRAGLHSSIVLSAYIEPLIRGRRVAVIGDATLGLADELAGRGARLVHAYDPEPARAAEALARALPGRSAAVSFAAFTGDLGVRDGAFDVVVVPDLALFPDPAEILRRARKLVAPTGAAVFVAPNTRAETRPLVAGGGPANTALGYYELYDLVSLQFAKVKMVGQAPFVGYTVADFAQTGELEVSVDTSLLASSEEPEHFIAVASDRPVVLEAYTVVELPWAEVAALQSAPRAAGPTSAELAEERLALTEARTRLSLVNAEMEKLRDRQQADAREAEARTAAATALSARVAELSSELEVRDARMREVDARAGDNHVRAERLGHQIRDLEEELRRQRDRGTKLAKQLDDEKRARTKAELELGMVRGLTSSVPPPPALPVLASEPVAAPTPRSVAPPADHATELAGARARIEAIGRELEGARLRIAELEQEQAETLRRVPAPAAPDELLTRRIAQLEEAVIASQREAVAASAGREAALARAEQLEGALARAEDARLGAAAREQALEARIGREGSRAADLERQLAAAHAQVAAAEVQSAAAHGQLAEARARLGEADVKLAAARARIADLEAKVAELGAKLADVERRPAELAARLHEAEQRAAAAADAVAAADAAAVEIAALEEALRERGRAIAELGREARESERIGKELIAELASAHSVNGVTSGVTPGDADDLRAQLDRLAAGAARAEADLQAASWRIAQLERQLADAGGGTRASTEVESELEAALAAARDEVASLRRALGDRAG